MENQQIKEQNQNQNNQSQQEKPQDIIENTVQQEIQIQKVEINNQEQKQQIVEEESKKQENEQKEKIEQKQAQIQENIEIPVEIKKVQLQQSQSVLLDQFLVDKDYKYTTTSPIIQKDFIKLSKISNSNWQCKNNNPILTSITENNFVHFNKIQDGKIKQLHTCKMGNPIYDFEYVTQKNKTTQVIALSIKDQPISFYDVIEDQENPDQLKLNFSGQLQDLKPMSEIHWAPLQMRAFKNHLVGLGNGFVRQYDINKFNASQFKRYDKKDTYSCIDFPNTEQPDKAVLGRFDKLVEVISLPNNKRIGKFDAHIGGITQVKFSKTDQNYLFSGARKDNLIYQWDLRMQNTFVQFFEREATNNQRLNFDITEDNLLIAGLQDGSVKIYDINDKQNTFTTEKIHDDVVNSCLYYKEKDTQKSYIISSSGQRRFYVENNFKNILKNQSSRIRNRNLKNNQSGVEESCSEYSSDTEDDEENQQQSLMNQQNYNQKNSLSLMEFQRKFE